MKACDSQVIGMVLALCASLASVGCEKKTQEYRLEQPINMGLFSFEVERTEESSMRLTHPSEGPNLEIRVYYRMLDNKTSPFGKTFDETLLSVRIVDKANNTIESGGGRVVSGDRRHPSEWVDTFTVSPSLAGVRDRAKLGQSASDFRLIIDNPDVRDGQPERVSIQLR
jgi:hypothetical protein